MSMLGMVLELTVRSVDDTQEKHFVLPDEVRELENFYYELEDAEIDSYIAESGSTAIREETNIEEIVSIFEDYTFEELVVEYLEESGSDGQVFEMSQINEVLSNHEPMKIVNMVRNADFVLGEPYFHFNGVGNLVTLDEQGRLDYLQLYFDEALDWKL